MYQIELFQLQQGQFYELFDSDWKLNLKMKSIEGKTYLIIYSISFFMILLVGKRVFHHSQRGHKSIYKQPNIPLFIIQTHIINPFPNLYIKPSLFPIIFIPPKKRSSKFIIISMLNQKQINQARQLIKRQILDLDHQINQLQTFYIEDTKQAGNLLKGFDNYISLKTSKIQSQVKKQKVQNYQRIFSLSSSTSRTSVALQEAFSSQPMGRMDISTSAPKRSRLRQGGKTKSGGKNVIAREENMQQQEQDSDSLDGEGGDDSMDESMGKSRQNNKKKKISKIPNPKKM